jgi:hypothetical protein
MQQYHEAVVTAFGRCYGDLSWAKDKAAEYWHDSGFAGPPPDFFEALLYVNRTYSVSTEQRKERVKWLLAAQAEAGATFLRTGSFPQWWDDEINEEALRHMELAKSWATDLEAKRKEDKKELEEVD